MILRKRKKMGRMVIIVLNKTHLIPVRVPMVGDRRRVLGRRWRLHVTLLLARHHDRQAVDYRHHHPLVRAAPSLRRVASPPLLVGDGPREHRPAVEGARIPLHLRHSCGWRVALRALQQPHHVGLESVRLADGRGRFRLVLVRLGVSVVTLHGGYGVPHAGRYHVGQALDRVSGVHFVPGYAGHLVHFGTGTASTVARSLSTGHRAHSIAGTFTAIR